MHCDIIACRRGRAVVGAHHREIRKGLPPGCWWIEVHPVYRCGAIPDTQDKTIVVVEAKGHIARGSNNEFAGIHRIEGKYWIDACLVTLLKG
jgi:hypothetical protein